MGKEDLIPVNEWSLKIITTNFCIQVSFETVMYFYVSTERNVGICLLSEHCLFN